MHPLRRVNFFKTGKEARANIRGFGSINVGKASKKYNSGYIDSAEELLAEIESEMGDMGMARVEIETGTFVFDGIEHDCFTGDPT